jgi:poly-gamma-glutamate system protein
MFIPSAKSKTSLFLLLVVSLALFAWVNNSRMFVKEKYHDEKLRAAQTMQQAFDLMKEYRLAQGIYIDEVNDPGLTALIGDKQTIITTDRGSLTAKLTSLNPNIAAVLIDQLKKAGVKAGDKIAVSWTGSFPAMNIGVMSAAKTLELDLIPITSVGASMFGATDPDFTWLDMETYFNDIGFFTYKSVGASIGGGRDMGRGLNVTGRDLIKDAIERNNVPFIFNNSLEKNISSKMELFANSTEAKYDLYINVGGGLSSLGNSINGRLISPGLHKHLNFKNIPLKGTLFLFAEQGVPVIHLLDMDKLALSYELPIAPDPIPEPGTGKMFRDERYNLTVTIVALLILSALVLIVVLFDHSRLKFREGELNPDNLR